MELKDAVYDVEASKGLGYGWDCAQVLLDFARRAAILLNRCDGKMEAENYCPPAGLIALIEQARAAGLLEE